MSDLVAKKKLRDFAEEVNGTRPTERSINGIANNLIENYHGGTGGTSNVFTNTDFYSLVGKHLSVDKLIDFLHAKNIEQGSDDFKIGRGIAHLYGGPNEFDLIHYYNSSDMMISICGYDLGISFDTDIDTTLQSAKTDIEAVILTDYLVKYNVYFINNEFAYKYEGDSINTSITLDEILDLFEE